MKLEIEITEEEVREAVKDRVRTAIYERVNFWSTENYIKKQVEAHFTSATDSLIADALRDSDILRKKIAEALERKLRAQLATAIRKSA